MSSPALCTEDYRKIDNLVAAGRRQEALNWIISHESIEQLMLLEYIKREHPSVK